MSYTVLHVTQATETGIPHVVEKHLSAQYAAGWRVVVACPGGSMATIAAQVGAEVVDWPSERTPRLRSLLPELLSLRRLVREVRPDVVHLHNAKAGLVGRLLLRGSLPTLFMPHAWSWHAAEGWQLPMSKLWERFATRWTDVFCCVSQSEIDEARSLGLRGDMRVVPHDVGDLRVGIPADRAAAREVLGEDPTGLLVVCCARLVPQKGQDLLLEAWRTVLHDVPDARLVLVGGGEDEAKLAALAAQIGPSVELVGSKDRDASLTYMLASDIVVCSSHYEGRSLVPLEAAALGRAVVTTDVQGAREGAVESASVIVPVGDAPALAAGIVGLLGDDGRRRHAELGAGRWSARASDEPKPTAQVLDMYDELLVERRRG